MESALHAGHALLPDGWAENVRMAFDDEGRIASLAKGAKAMPGDARAAIAVPGMGNLHCHALQRAMAGLAERASPGGQDTFWSWRETMYDVAARIGPGDLCAIAAMAYMEMLCSGFTGVGEFHYLHNRPDGGVYDDPAETAVQIVRAAAQTGINLTLLPVYYARAGFDGSALEPRQRRFGQSLQDYAMLVTTLMDRFPDLPLGIAPHSLRAVSTRDVRALVEMFPGLPVHMHAAEQPREVEDCRAALGAPPVRWLLDHAGVDGRWCLVHATHMDAQETRDLARSGAVAGLCPVTEADLGDGIFPAIAYLGEGGRFGLGSDSCVRIDLAGEVRLLDYGQRLISGTRTPLAPPGRSAGAALFTRALQGGAQALGQETGALAQGHSADIVTLDPGHPALVARSGDAWLDGWIYAAAASPVQDVYVRGRRVVHQGRHKDAARIEQAFVQVMHSLNA